MKIVYGVDSDSLVTLGADAWRTVREVSSFKACVSLVFPITVDGTNVADRVDFEGDSLEVLRIFETAVEMLKHEHECRFHKTAAGEQAGGAKL